MIGILLATTLCAYSDPCAYLVKDRVVVPLRFVCDQLQSPIDYDMPTRSASMKWNDTAITFTINKNVAIVNGKKVRLPSDAKVFDERLYVPLRFLSDTLGLPLFWSPETQEAVLRMPKDGTAFGRFVRMKLVSPDYEILYDGTKLAHPKPTPAALPGTSETPPAALPGTGIAGPKAAEPKAAEPKAIEPKSAPTVRPGAIEQRTSKSGTAELPAAESSIPTKR
jgi:hypothetical protein